MLEVHLGEFQLGHLLDAIIGNPEYRAALKHLDRHGLFEVASNAKPMSIDDLLLSGDNDAASLFDHKRLPPSGTREAPDKVGRRRPCPDFHLFEQGFQDCHDDLREGRRELRQFSKPSNIKEGFFYLQRRMLVYVAEIGYSPRNRLASMAVCAVSTRTVLNLTSCFSPWPVDCTTVTERNDSYVESFPTPDHVATGFVYVARTHTENTELKAFLNLHEIGYTTNAVEARLSGAANDPTFLLAKASLVAIYEMPAEYAKIIETLLHQLFSEVRLDVWYDAGNSATEWFDVTASAVEQAIELIQSNQLAHYKYDQSTGSLVLS